LRPFGDQFWYHYEITKAVSTMKRENVTVDALAERVAESEKEFDAIPGKVHEKGKYEGKMKGEFETLQRKITKTRELLSIYELYQKGLEAAKRYDFEDVILEVVHALQENENFKREVQEGVHYVLADEHQDANKSQNAFLELLTDYDDHPNLFIVGDEKQAIYRFQGADLDNVHYFHERFTGTKVIVLTQNYRSTQTILDSALTLIEASPDERLSRLPLAANSDVKERPVTIAVAQTSEAEADFLAEKIRDLMSAGVPADSIAILVRRNRDTAWLEDALAKRGVPLSGSGDERNALTDPYVQALRRLLEAVHEQRDERLISVLTLPGFKLSPADIWRITQHARVSRMPIIDIFRKTEFLEAAGVLEVDRAQAMVNTLDGLGKLAAAERPAVVAEEAFKKSGLLRMLLERTSIDGAYASNTGTREKHFGAMRAFFSLLEELSSHEHDALLPRALELLTLYEERGIPLKGQEDESMSVGCVKIMTAHKAKGREFAHVFVPRLTESAWSTRNRAEHFYLPDILSGATELEDERRLLYVAMTRAKEHLTISYSLTRDDGKETAPSALLEDIDSVVAAKLIEKVVIEEKPESNELEFLPSGGRGTEKSGADGNMVDGNTKGNTRGASLRAPSADDLTTLRNAFIAQGLSPTALNNFLECPSKYFYTNLLRLPQPENKSMLYGTAIHAALKAYADRRERGDDVPGDYLVKEFNRVISKTALSARDIEDSKEKAKRALTAWWQANQVSWPSKTETELPVEAEFTLPETEDATFSPEGSTFGSVAGTTFTIRGNLDRLDPLPSGTVRVIDYKTGKPKSRNELLGKTASSAKTASAEKSDEGDRGSNYYRQLQFYKLLLARADKPREMSEGIIEFVEPDDKGQMHSETFMITDEEVKELETIIAQTAESIMTLSFWDTHCDDPDCEWCALRLNS
jgi:DNA helicase-2/ATP-dependent DNA helicase PcrA